MCLGRLFDCVPNKRTAFQFTKRRLSLPFPGRVMWWWVYSKHREHTSAAIESVLSSPHPPARVAVAYSGSLPAWFGLWLRWGMPDHVWDKVIRAVEG